MKDTEKSKPTKKKLLFYYLILAACLLIIAAITIAVVFSVRGRSVEQTIDNGGNTEQPDNDTPDETQDIDDTEKTPTDTSTSNDFVSPVSNMDMTQKQDLWYDATLKRYYMHRGADFAADVGTEVLAVLDGTVTEISTSDTLYGGVITITHADNIVTVYKFIDPLESLSVGDKVSRGDVIATVAAATGAEIEEGPHLHFEVYANGVLTDPDEYLGDVK